MNTTAITITMPKNMLAKLVTFVASTSEIVDSTNAPTTGPSTLPGPPNTVMMIIFTLSETSNTPTGSMNVMK